MKYSHSRLQLQVIFLMTAAAAGFILLSTVQAQTATVHAVLFYSPTCPHCTFIKGEMLPPLLIKHGSQIQIVEIDVSAKAGQEMYRAAVLALQIPQDRLGVPTLVIGRDVLVGSIEIEAAFPGLIDQYLSAGGVGWPEISGLDTWVASIPAADTPTSVRDTAADRPRWLQNFLRDPTGNFLAVLTLGILLIVLGRSAYLFYTGKVQAQTKALHWLIPVVAVMGIGVASYLAFVETTETAAFCGPIGDCNSVQQSQYAVLFGIIPVGILGIIVYAAILITWTLQVFGPKEWRSYGQFALWLMAIGGTIFSLYLTFLEPFVIGATCIWCITSALLMAVLLWTTTPPGIAAWQSFFETPDDLDQTSISPGPA